MNRFSLVIVSACALLVCTAGFAQEAAPDPKALVEQAGAFLQKQGKFSVDASMSMKITSPAANQESSASFQITLVRPNRLAMIANAGELAASVYSDGENIVTYHQSLNKYLVETAPDNVGQFTEKEAGQIFAGPGGFLLNVLSPNPAESLLEGTTGAKYVGKEEIAGKSYHRCRFEQEQFDWDIWIAAEGDPLIHRFVPDMTKQLQSLPEEMRRGFKMELRVAFDKWNLDPTINESTFVFAPPEGAEKVNTFLSEQEEEGPHPLLGKVAPPFQLQNLEGKPVDLARHAGKQIVILDFWATWCGPCIAAMPEVKATADKFADKGVVVYFVNLQEDAETIREFLKEQKLVVPVALDIEGAVAAEYGVSGIPQTVIIGKDGKVQVVHVGFSDNLQKQLTVELEGILAGKDLAAEVLAKYEENETPNSREESP